MNKVEDSWWGAVASRDVSLDGQFVYGVRSTGIFCRPSCPARRPKRANVIFFAVAEQAKRAGFRECKRCRPLSLRANPQIEIIKHICRYIEEHKDESLSLEKLSELFKLSPYHLQRTFKKIVGVSPGQYANACRNREFKKGLQQMQTVIEAIFEAGFSSSSRVYEKGTGQLGMNPVTYKKKGQGIVIKYAILSTDLGFILIAATAKGLCNIRFGDSKQELESALQGEFSAATIIKAPHELTKLTQSVLACLAGKTANNTLPLDIRATAFQQAVWDYLRSIPKGETRSYSDVAKAIGQPAAGRAVARACASNPVAIVIPCHRVTGKNGELSGYRWGKERKRILLDRETVISGKKISGKKISGKKIDSEI